jgi:S1-C subfamily serine protease
VLEEIATVGRDPQCDVPLHSKLDNLVSSKHLEIRTDGGRFILRDLESRNGTFIDGVRIKGDMSVVAGTEFTCGPDGPLLRIELATAASSGRTGIYQALMRDEVDKVASRFKIIIAALILVITAGGAGAAWYFVKQREKSDALEEQGRAAARIAQDNERALFMLIAKDESGTLTGYCTAFAVDRTGILATNAHCIKSLEAHRAAGRDAVVRMNADAERTYQVTKWKKHPDYDGTPSSPDVAILELDLRGEQLSTAVTLADSVTVGLVETGQAVFLLGFPGKVMNEASPSADLRQGIVSRLTTFDNATGSPSNTRLLWHTALTSRGTSGSPIFNIDGDVIAVNNGGFSAREVQVVDPETGETTTEIAYDATGLNFGVRVDVLKELVP